MKKKKKKNHKREKERSTVCSSSGLQAAKFASIDLVRLEQFERSLNHYQRQKETWLKVSRMKQDRFNGLNHKKQMNREADLLQTWTKKIIFDIDYIS